MENQVESQHNSLSENLNGLDQQPNLIIDQQIEQVDYNKKIENVHQIISQLNEEQQILKQTLKVKEKQLLEAFKLLDERKRLMRDLYLRIMNKEQIQLDIGLSEQFEELKNVIQNQKKEMQQLKEEISRQGLNGRNNDQEFIKVLFKIGEMQREIEVGRKFASTQYVRDYLEKPQVYKVGYQQVKYEFEMRGKMKQKLQEEKQHYLKKKDEIGKAIIREKQMEQQLLQEKDRLLVQLKSLS